MSHDRPSDPADARLAALYQAHAVQAEQPSAASDARILALARDALARPAAKRAASGWRSWPKASWFGPGLALATIASLSVVVVSLIPKEDLSVERAITSAPGTPPPAPPAAPAASVATPAPMRAPAPSAESAAASSATSTTSESSAKQAPDGQSKPKLARTNESARPLPQRSAPITTMPAVPAAPAAPTALPAPASAATPAASISKAMPQRVEAAPAPAPVPAPAPAAVPAPAPALKVEQPNAFPAQSPPVAAGQTYQAAAAPPAVAAPAPRAAPAAAAADAGAAQQLEKPSLLSEPTESRMTANQPVPEVRDSAPTYPNEARSSIPLPYTYTTPRAPARDAAPGLGGAAGSLAGRPSAPPQLAATRKEDVAERRAADKSAPPAAAAPGAAAMAAAPPLRDPAEWIKAIQKLRLEGKAEQVTKELTEFRRQYPRYPLPDELKQLIK